MSFDKLNLKSEYLSNQVHAAANLTKWLWVDNNTFIIPVILVDGSRDILKLVYITLFPNKTFSTSIRSVDHIKNLVLKEENAGYVNWFGNFFTVYCCFLGFLCNVRSYSNE